MFGHRHRLLTILALVASLVAPATVADAASLTVKRVAGADRYETAVEISKESFPGGAQVAFVATGLNHADSVAITAIGGGFGPVLLTTPTALPASTRAELQRLGPDIVYVLGGRSAVSDAVQFDIVKALTGTGVIVDRISGENRYETAVAISRELRPDARVVYLADGHDYAAGITAAAAAGVNGGVLLTTSARGLPSSVSNELARINPTTLIAVGDLSSDVVSSASSFAAELQWIKGTSAVDLSTALSVSTWASTIDVLVASAADFPDALAAAAWAVGANVPLLLTNPAKLEASTACEVLRLRASGAIVAGGTRAVSTAVTTALTDIKPREYGCTDPIKVDIPDPDPNTEELEVTLYEMTTSPDGTRAYVINNSWNSIEVIDVISGVWLGRIAVGSNPVDVDISTDGKRLYVVNNGAQTVSVIDLTAPFDRAEIAQVPMVYAGPNARRTLAIETASDGKSFIVPARLEGADTEACLQVMTPDLKITELEPGTDFNIPIGAVQVFHSADHKMVGVIAPDRGTTTTEDVTCQPSPEPEPEPEPTETPTEGEEPAQDPAIEDQALALFTYINGKWSRVGAWGRNVAEIAYGNINENGVTSDGNGTATVFEAVDRSAVLGTVTSEATTFGLAIAPLQPNCPKTRGNPAICTQLAYSVIVGPDGLGAVEVLDITSGRNVSGSYRVVEQIALQSVVGTYGGKNQPNQASLLNQAAVTADARSLVVATELSVEIIPIG